jgi:hypothetical protein
MKKIILIFSLLVLFSCSSNESVNDSSNASGVLLKKIVSSDVAAIVNFNYNGNKILNYIDDGDGEKVLFSHTENFITKMEWFNVSNNERIQTVEFIYTSNKLTKTKLYSSNNTLESISDFQLNSDGSVTETESNYNGGNSIVSTYVSKLYLDAAGNLIKSESANSAVDLTYDNKNSLFKNVTGFEYLRFCRVFPFQKNNVKDITTTNSESSPITDYSARYQYNNQDYPISSSVTQYGKRSTLTYFY